jgi:hypothetical protein
LGRLSSFPEFPGEVLADQARSDVPVESILEEIDEVLVIC